MRAALLPVLLAAGCVTETAVTEARPDAAVDVVANPAIFHPPARPPEEVIEVPASAYAPVDRFFDHQGYLVGDRVVIDCSFEPFRTRFVENRLEGLVREETKEEGVLAVRIRNTASGEAYQTNAVPIVTFGSHREPPLVTDPATGKVVAAAPQPIFEFVGTEEVLVRFHLNSPRERPVWFEARAAASDPANPRDSIYTNVNRKRRELAMNLALSVEILRSPAGEWSAEIRDPGGPPAAGR